MYAPHGATHDSSSPQQRRGGYLRRVPILGLLIPNLKAKHRTKTHKIQWRYELHYILNRWYVVGRPRLRQILKRIGLRK